MGSDEEAEMKNPRLALLCCTAQAINTRRSFAPARQGGAAQRPARLASRLDAIRRLTRGRDAVVGRHRRLSKCKARTWSTWAAISTAEKTAVELGGTAQTHSGSRPILRIRLTASLGYMGS